MLSPLSRAVCACSEYSGKIPVLPKSHQSPQADGALSKLLILREKPEAGEANRTPDPNLGNVIALFEKWLKSKLFSLLGDET
jgi:hypothetical protein